jgi:hypothetical protein
LNFTNAILLKYNNNNNNIKIRIILEFLKLKSTRNSTNIYIYNFRDSKIKYNILYKKICSHNIKVSTKKKKVLHSNWVTNTNSIKKKDKKEKKL